MKPTSEGTYIALALLALNAIWASFAPTMLNAAFAFLVFLVFVPSMLRSAPAYVVAMSPLLFYWTTELLSGIAIEGGAFMVETDATGGPSGAFARLALIYAALFLAGRQVWRTDPLHSADIPQTTGFMGEGVIIFASFALIGSFFLFGALNGFPLLEGIDRYAYRRGIGSDALTSFLDNKTIYYSLIGMAAASGRYKRSAVTLFILGICISLLYGEKFTTIVEGFLFFFIPVILQRFAESNPLPLRQLAYGGAAAIAITVPAILINYGALYDFETAIYQLAARASLQGQLWFLVDRDYGQLLAFNSESITAAVRSLYMLSEQSQFIAGTTHGMYFVMEPYTDVEKLYWTMYAGGGFIFAHFPYWLMVSGYAGMLLIGLLTVLTLSWVTRRTVLALRRTDPISLVIWLKVLVWVYAGFVLGNFWFFYGVKTLALILAACLWDALAAAMRQRNAPEVKGTSTRPPKLIRRVA